MKKYLFFLLAFVFFSFTADQHKSTYTIPQNAFSVTTGDINLNGYIDIVVGHRIPWQQNSPVITILNNNKSGDFSIYDTIDEFYGYQHHIILTDVDNNSYPDIISLGIDASGETSEMFIRVIYNSEGEYDSYQDFYLNTHEPISDIDYGDINNDGNVDIAITSNHGQFWGILYNDGNGSFLEPEYYNTEEAYPNSIDCGDINGDGRADIVLCRQTIEVFFSNLNGFENATLEEGSSWKHASQIVDFDLDGKNDVITFGGTPLTLLDFYKNIEDNNFEAQAEFVGYFQSSEFQICDLNNDDYQDVVFELLDHSGYIIYYNQGDFHLADSQFVALPPSIPAEQWRSFNCADLDGNGYQDIICVKTVEEEGVENLEILFNNGEGGFVDNPISAIHKQYTSNNSISAYPNPFQTYTSIHFELKTPSLISINISNINGQIVYQRKEEYSTGKQQILWDGKDINRKNCQSGVYIVSISTNNKITKHIKIIKR